MDFPMRLRSLYLWLRYVLQTTFVCDWFTARLLDRDYTPSKIH